MSSILPRSTLFLAQLPILLWAGHLQARVCCHSATCCSATLSGHTQVTSDCSVQLHAGLCWAVPLAQGLQLGFPVVIPSLMTIAVCRPGAKACRL